jgi:kynurenine formamidase
MNTLKLAAAALLGGAALVATAGEDWYPSRWGAGDVLGGLNNVTTENVLAATKLVGQGKVQALGIETNSKTPTFAPRTFNLTVVQPNQAGGGTLGPTKSTYNDDLVMGWNGIGSQMDGLGHVGIDHVYYNGAKAADFVAPDGLKKYGMESYPPMVARGVLLDMCAFYGKGIVPEGTAFNRKEIDAVSKKQGIEIREGDVVLFNTGWITLIGKEDVRYMAGEPGLGKEGALYLADMNVTAVGADNFGVEVVPFEEGNGQYEIHQILLARKGIFLLENMNTAPLARDRAYEFLFVLGQPRITGAVQAIVNPVAIY